jgi:hypothetical protein
LKIKSLHDRFRLAVTPARVPPIQAAPEATRRSVHARRQRFFHALLLQRTICTRQMENGLVRHWGCAILVDHAILDHPWERGFGG